MWDRRESNPRTPGFNRTLYHLSYSPLRQTLRESGEISPCGPSAAQPPCYVVAQTGFEPVFQDYEPCVEPSSTTAQ
jgi:hypothetical protein